MTYNHSSFSASIERDHAPCIVHRYLPVQRGLARRCARCGALANVAPMPVLHQYATALSVSKWKGSR